MSKYFKTHSLYFNILFSEKIKCIDKETRDHVIAANWFEWRVWLFFKRYWVRLIPHFSKSKLLFDIRWINFNITIWIADWKESWPKMK